MNELPGQQISITDFKRQTARFVKRIKSSGQPFVLTVNGKPELIIQDAASYKRLIDRLGESLQQSILDADAGRTRPMREALASLGARH